MKRLHHKARILAAGSWLAAMLWIFMLPVQSVSAQAQPAEREYQIKASILYHFLQFVEWPESAFIQNPGELVVGVLGKDPFGAVLDRTLAGKTVRGKKLVIRRYASPEDVEACHLLFVSTSVENRVKEVLHSLTPTSVLTVGESARFTQHGGIIRLFEFKNKVRFEINQEAAQRATLRVSSKLLKLARVV